MRLQEQLGDMTREEDEIVARKTQLLEELRQNMLDEQKLRSDLENRIKSESY